jgi:serine/threonine protein phosphatase PrpC
MFRLVAIFNLSTWPQLSSVAWLIRSLGDVVAHSAGVISEPEFSEFELNPKTDKFLVVATDGLWEFIDNQETTEMVEGQVGPAQAVDTLVTEAGTRWMQEEQVIDDTTVIVANLFGWKASS